MMSQKHLLSYIKESMNFIEALCEHLEMVFLYPKRESVPVCLILPQIIISYIEKEKSSDTTNCFSINLVEDVCVKAKNSLSHSNP